jgi:hypothetical protein
MYNFIRDATFLRNTLLRNLKVITICKSVHVFPVHIIFRVWNKHILWRVLRTLI